MLGCAHGECLYSPPCPGLFAASELMLISILSTSLSSDLAWDYHPAMGLLTELRWDFFNGKHSYFIPVWKDQSFLTLHFLCEMTPRFLASPTRKTLGCFWKFSRLDVCPLLICIYASQLTRVTWSKRLGVLFLSYFQFSNTRTSERPNKILPMIHLAQHLAFSRGQQGMPWAEYQNRKRRYLLSIILQFPLIWACGTPKLEVVPFYFNPILLYTCDIIESWHLTIITTIFNKDEAQHYKGFYRFPK